MLEVIDVSTKVTSEVTCIIPNTVLREFDPWGCGEWTFCYYG